MVPGSELPLMWFTGNFSWQIILLQVEQQLFVPFTVFSPAGRFSPVSDGVVFLCLVVHLSYGHSDLLAML